MITKVFLKHHYVYGPAYCISFFGSASVMWSASISVFLYRKFTLPKRPPSYPLQRPLSAQIKRHKSMIIYHALSWSVPLLQGVFLFDTIKPSSQELCLPEEPYFVLFYYVPISIAILISLVVYTVFVRDIVVKASFTVSTVVMQIPFRLALYVLVMFICWIPNIVAYSFEGLLPAESRRDMLVIVNGLMELQGFLDCVVYGMTNKDFRRHYAGVRGFVHALFSPVLLPFSIIVCLYKKFRTPSSVDEENAPISAGTSHARL